MIGKGVKRTGVTLGLVMLLYAASYGPVVAHVTRPIALGMSCLYELPLRTPMRERKGPPDWMDEDYATVTTFYAPLLELNKWEEKAFPHGYAPLWVYTIYCYDAMYDGHMRLDFDFRQLENHWGIQLSLRDHIDK